MSVLYLVILSRADGEGPRPFRSTLLETLGTVSIENLADIRALALRGPSPSSRLGMTALGSVARNASS